MDASEPKPPRRLRSFTIFLVVTLIVVAVFGLNFHTVQVQGISMFPTLKNGQRVLVSKAYWLVGGLKKNDIVVVAEESGKGYFIKRIWGMPGDVVEYGMAPRSWPITQGEYKVPEGKIHVIGDNFPHSEDSRKFGPVDEARILGKVVVAR